LILCIDPAFTNILQDFETDKCETRFLMIDIDLTNKFCAGHANRMGLLETPNPEEDEAIIRTLRHNLRAEQEHVADMELRSLEIVSPNDTADKMSRAIRRFLNVDKKAATNVLKQIGYLEEGVSNVVSL